MTNNSQRIRTIFMVSLCLHLVMSGCSRRPLEDEGSATALVPFSIDWSQSGLDQSKMNSASIWFFPHDGSASFEWRLQEDLTKAVVPLAAGKYSIVVFNETVDPTDWTAIAFEGAQKYETFNVYATASRFKGLFSRAATSDIRNTPDTIASWSLDEFEVTPTMIAYTRGQLSKSAGSDAISRAFDTLATITPLPLTVAVHVEAYVIRLKSSLRCSAALDGATGKMSLATGRPVPGTVTHVFSMNNRKYDSESSLNGTIEANFLLFKFLKEDIRYELQLDFQLTDGKIVPPELFNVTDQIDKDKHTIVVDVGLREDEKEEDDDKDHPIVLPEVDIEGAVGVDEWDDKNIAIK